MENNFNSYGYSESTNGLLSNTLRQSEIDEKQDKEIKNLQSSTKVINCKLNIDFLTNKIYLKPTKEIQNTAALINEIKNGAFATGVVNVDVEIAGGASVHIFFSGVILGMSVLDEGYEEAAFFVVPNISSQSTTLMVIYDMEPDEENKSNGGDATTIEGGNPARSVGDGSGTLWDLVNEMINNGK